LALQLHPDNVAALVNSDYNKILQAGGHESGPPSEAVAKKLAVYGGSWDSVLTYNGPLDEPNTCFLVAQRFANGRNFRQAAQYLERVRALTPENVSAQIAFAGVCVQAGRPDQTLQIVAEIRNTFTNLSHNDQLVLFECEAWAHVLKNDLRAAEKILVGAQTQFPDRAEPYKAMAEIYLNRGDWTNATVTLGKLVETQPNNLDGLINFAALKMRMGQYAEAIPLLDQALHLQPENFYALLNHGIANLQLNNLDAARQDYEALERRLPRPMHMVHWALGEIAFKKKQKSIALREYEKYLKLAPGGTPEVKDVQDRIYKIKRGAF
jgi:tetratricopeptide (TPR) repeat protein